MHLKVLSVQRSCCGKYGLGINAHGEPNNHDAQEGDDEGTPLAHAIRDVGENDGKDSCSDVDRDGHELRSARGVAQVPDDGRQEQADTVERAHNLGRLVSSNRSQ